MTPARLRGVGPDDEDDAQTASSGVPALSDLDMADRWVSGHGEHWRYVKEWDQWLQWRDSGWHVDQTGSVVATVMDMLRIGAYWPAARGFTGAQRRSLCSAKTVAAVLKLASSHSAVAMPAETWDVDPMLLGTPAGTVDLRTGKIRPSSKADYITKRTAVAPAMGDLGLWRAHLRKIFVGDIETIMYLQRWFGYCLTGRTGEHAMLMLHGSGANGKSGTMETIAGLMGDYAYSAPINLLMESHQERHPAELAMLQGKRLVLCSEPPQGSKWDDGRLRSLTGDAKLTARRMNKDFSTFYITHKLNVMCNHRPALRSVDEAMRRRVNLLAFKYTIPPDERDPDFLEKLRAEWPMILSWMIDGCLHWQEAEGLNRPESVSADTVEYLSDEDTPASFIDECCDRGPAKFDSVATVYRVYSAWCEKQGEKPMARKAFRAFLRDVPGVEAKRSAGDAVGGLAVKDSMRAVTHAPVSSGSWMQD